jgi:hypothetical protein
MTSTSLQEDNRFDLYPDPETLFEFQFKRPLAESQVTLLLRVLGDAARLITDHTGGIIGCIVTFARFEEFKKALLEESRKPGPFQGVRWSGLPALASGSNFPIRRLGSRPALRKRVRVDEFPAKRTAGGKPGSLR